jgi:hypothetical protein
MNGLKMTRRYRSSTHYFRASSRFVFRFTFDPLETLFVKFGLIRTRQRTLFWTKKTRTPQLLSDRRAPGHATEPKHASSPPQAQPKPPRNHPMPGHHTSPSIELTDYSTAEYGTQDTPAMAHFLSLPELRPARPRNASDASFTEPRLPIYEQYCARDDSHRALVTHPSEVHHSRAVPMHVDRRSSDEREGRPSSDFTEARSSNDFMLFPTSLYDGHGGSGNWSGAMHSRQRYQRANSDPGNPPVLDKGIPGGAGEDEILA